MILRIIIVAALLIAAVLAFAAMKPDTFHLQSSAAEDFCAHQRFPQLERLGTSG
jgi:hypothetical protein